MDASRSQKLKRTTLSTSRPTGQGLVRKGFIELPPTLFAPAGGRLTELGLAELDRLET